MPRKRKTPFPTDLDQREVKVEIESSSPGWHAGGEELVLRREEESLRKRSVEPAPRDFHLPDSRKSVGAPRTRESKFSPAPSHFPRGPPGFDNGARFSPHPVHFPAVPKNPPGFDKSNRFHGVKMEYRESLEITSDRPFLPQRRAPPGGSDMSSSPARIPRDDMQDFNTHETDPRKSTSAAKMRKKMQPSANDAQSPHAGTIVLASSFERATSPALRSGVLGKPSVPPSGVAMVPNSAAVDGSSESPSEVCLKLWKDLGLAMQKRERTLRERERSLKQNSINKQVLEEEVNQAAALKNEVMEERKKLEEEAQRIKTEKDDMERTSTDIAVQMVELKQVQKEIEKEKAAILALKLELGAREGCSQVQECVEAAVHISLGAVKAEIETPISNPSINCLRTVYLSSDSGVTPSNSQIREQNMGTNILFISKVSATANDRNREPGKAEPVTSEWDAVHVDESRRYDNSSEDDMDDVPLAIKLKTKRVKRAGETSRSREEIKHAESNVESSRKRAGSQSVGDKSQSYESHMKKNKVPIEVALQEDAPGLLEQLEERGVLEDMSVYQDMGMDDSLPTESSGSEFGVLEGVIGKLWGPSVGLGKDLVPVKGQASGNMPRYCLACLLSLIEQAKSLRKRNWPVEWGWCRRLRAFLFVFEKHNRIVLERPEYGYATYFFELVQQLPVRWQVQRLITVMSVATTGRAALLENRQLEVGVHLTNEEAAILEDYGWNPSSGLGSLLNFCERVVHDYNKGQEDLGYDWKQKIGKLLMDGYDHGSMVTSIPRKLQRVLGDSLRDTDSFPRSQAKAEPA